MTGQAGFRRKLFYLSGYDPRGARFYHQLHAEQAAIYAGNSGHDMTVSERRRSGPHNSVWTIEDRTENALTDYEVLGWDDFIRRNWSIDPLRMVWGSIHATFRFSRAWDWRRHGRHVPLSSLVCFYYPALTLVALPLALVALGWLLVGPLIAIPLGLGLGYLSLRYFHSLWLLRFIMFNDRYIADGPIAELEERLDRMAETIDAALSENWNEIILVTHSNGSILSIPLMHRLLARRSGAMPANFALLTLGSCIPLISARKDARNYNDLLTDVAKGDFLWLDLGSKTDGACLPLVDPCLTADTDRRPTLHVRSPRWFRYCDPATYRQRRRNKYETHFEYLRTFERISPLDYIRVTSCGQPLAASIAAFGREPD